MTKIPQAINTKEVNFVSSFWYFRPWPSSPGHIAFRPLDVINYDRASVKEVTHFLMNRK